MAQSAPLTVAQSYDGGTDALVTLAGVLDGAAVSGVERRLTRLLSRGVSSLVIDVSGLCQCDCRFLSVLEPAAVYNPPTACCTCVGWTRPP